MNLKQRILEFRSNISPDLYSPEDIIDFAAAREALSQQVLAIKLLQQLSETKFERERLAEAIVTEPKLYSLLCSILFLSSEVQLEDGRKLPAPHSPPRSQKAALDAADVLLELGIASLLPPHSDIEHVALLLQVSVDSARRRFRVDSKLKARVFRIVASAIEEAGRITGLPYEVGTSSLIPLSVRGMVEYTVLLNRIPCAAVSVTFQSHSGGRQSRELSSSYPSLHRALLDHGIELFLIADGRGIGEASDRVLTALTSSVPQAMSLKEAESGRLLKGLVEQSRTVRQPREEDVSVAKLIESALSTGQPVMAASLPVSLESSRLALARYASANSELNLELSPDGSVLAWRSSKLVQALFALRTNFQAAVAVGAAVSVLNGTTHSEMTSSAFCARSVRLDEAEDLLSTTVVGASPLAADPELVRSFAKEALQSGLHSKFAILIAPIPPSQEQAAALATLQSFLPISVVVVSLVELDSLARSKQNPSAFLQATLLQQSDLTKLSPFVVRGVTPSRVFFGREEEESTLLSTLATNSVALLGGRRIGKTSLMRHCSGRLELAGLRPFFGDCQVVRSWEDFGKLAERNWKVNLNGAFMPSSLYSIVEQLAQRDPGGVVILLDEIDQLLDWDSHRSEDEVPEAFFRTCRSISQQGMAQFVFSGERTIAKRIWDASSPHWNFCRPLLLRQLSRAAAESLISEPLESMGIDIANREELLEICWSRTSGHPELLQFVGDKLVTIVNSRSRGRIEVDPSDVLSATDTYEFAEQYLETYWGQSNHVERIISLWLLEGSAGLDALQGRLIERSVEVSGFEVQSGLRMLELYGIAEQVPQGYSLRLEWFRSALEYYGGASSALSRYLGELRHV